MKTPTRICAFAICVLMAGATHAELLDPPFFNLWSGETGGLDQPGDELLVCGTDSCSANANLEADGAEGWAIFRTVEANYGKGSGAIDPFLRFEHNVGGVVGGAPATGSQAWEAAFNTNFRDGTITGQIELDKNQFDPNLPNDEDVIYNQAKDHSHFNHVLMLGDLLDSADSKGYLHFLLDINEPGNDKSTLRLDELAFFVGDGDTDGGDRLSNLVQDRNNGGDPNVTLTGAENGGKAIWDMDWDISNADGGGYGGLVLDNINDSGPAGSGDYDVELLLHKDLFADYQTNDWVYLYNFMGNADTDCDGSNNDGVTPETCDPSVEAQAGFEEWAFDTSAGGDTPGIPEPATWLLMGGGLFGYFASRRRQII